MTFEIIESDGKPIKAWTRGVPVEESAKQQLRNLAGLPFIYKHVAAMPDIHWGMGATVGSVIATQGAIIPAAVGVDIGCFVGETKIPLLDGTQKTLNELAERAEQRASHHMGTLGTGNHFIEVCLDESQDVWIMLHSGSRGIGNAIGSMFIELAKKDMQRWFINLPDADLAYIPEGSELFNDYVNVVYWAQEFALLNRETMMALVIEAITTELGRPFLSSQMAVNCHHNYISREHHFGSNAIVTRKGAVRAREGDFGIIPGSMGAKSFIVRGKGNADSFHSCSHGAGRAMSRGQARRQFTLEDHAKATEGVECRKDADVIDETPAAYKDVDAVMLAQVDLVDIVHTLKQVVCVKG